MYRETFCLLDAEGTVLRRSSSIGMLFSWLIEHRYFEEHPGITLKLTEEHTPKFAFEVRDDTTSRDAADTWKKFNHYI